MTATGWTDDVVDLPLTYSFAYHVAGDGGEQAPVVVQQIRGRDLASSSSFSPSAGNGSVVLTVQGQG